MGGRNLESRELDGWEIAKSVDKSGPCPSQTLDKLSTERPASNTIQPSLQLEETLDSGSSPTLL